MTSYQIRVKAAEVRTESGICPGMAKTRQGEVYAFQARTPASEGMCTNSFNAVYPMSLAMRLTEKMDWEKEKTFDVICPHGYVTYRPSRVRETDE